MKYLSVCSGIEAATVAWHPLGWEPVGFSEIEPFPSAVLAHHYPNVTNFGDMTKYKEWDIGTDRLDLLVGGTPCQSFSVAGLRKGLDDPRGNLALVYCGMLDHFRPTWFVWENVPGVLSSSGGRDFGSFLGAVAELGYGFAYRVLDAQFFGVPQRRRRVFVVGYLGDWRPATAVLFERESLRRDLAPCREKRKVTPTLSSSGTGVSRVGFNCEDEWFVESKWPANLAPTLNAHFGDKQGLEDQHVNGGCGLFVPAQSFVVHGTQDPCVSDIAFAQGRNNGGENVLAQPIAAFKGGQGSGAGGIGYSEYVAPTLPASDGGNRTPTLMNGMAVRRLTPVECERLQGFPDNYTNISWRKKEESPDGPRYKALGNSMAVPCMYYIGNRINGYTSNV